jgi:hypothetical protein
MVIANARKLISVLVATREAVENALFLIPPFMGLLSLLPPIVGVIITADISNFKPVY